MTYARQRLQPNAKPIDHLYTDRLRQFTNPGGEFRDLNLPAVYDLERRAIGGLKSYRVPDGPNGETQRPLWRDIDWDNVTWEEIGIGYNFGPLWKLFWVKFDVEIPENWLLHEAIELEWDLSSEAMITNDKGLPLQAFTGGERNYFRFPKEYVKKDRQTFYMEVACNGMFGNGLGGHPEPNRYFRLNRCDLVLPNLPARKLHIDFWILSDAAREYPGGQWQKYKALTVCNEIMNDFKVDEPKSVDKGRERAQELLGSDINSEEVFSKFAGPERIDVYGIGNCHIDTAWEWPFAETKRKIVRLWTTQLKICEEYPEYVFVALQMQQFKWLKQLNPEILEKIKEKFHTNQFFPIGGLWVENDTNLPNGELLIRQFLVGQRFQYNEFGFYSNIYWLPDTFGYTSQVPQICQLAGINRFLTQKLSWNNINLFPLLTFNWVGLDGSQVLVHMPPANTYTASAHFGDIWRLQHQHKNLGQLSQSMLLYGHGDGGGGPTEEMIEKIRRCRGLANTLGLMPNVHLGCTVDDFYDEILKNLNQGEDLPLWLGEMYLEYHRGTYTTQALIKRLERHGEVKMHTLEMLAALVSLQYDDYKYPAKDVLSLWEDLLLCQFHDVFPGSCIGMVYYDEAYPMLTKDHARMDKLIKEALDFVKDKRRSLGEAVSVVNPLPWARSDVLIDTAADNDVKFWARRQGIESNIVSLSVSDDSVTSLNKGTMAFPASHSKDGDAHVLSNGLLKAKINDLGVITSLYDIENDREVIDTTVTKETGIKFAGANQYILVDDEPLNFPAWDTEVYAMDKFEFLTKGKVIDAQSNELESLVTVRHDILQKLWIETIISMPGVFKKLLGVVAPNYVRFKCKVRWHETYKFLKVQFPVDIHTATQASYETQFGVTQRPTTANTSWEAAKFEVCHHKFMDLLEYNYGVLVLNESKYGALVCGNVMRLLLLRLAKAPDDQADMGDHHFEYALYPHAGALGSDTVKLAWDFNYRVCHTVVDSQNNLGKLLLSVRLEQALGGSLVLSHIKRGENDHDVNTYAAFVTQSKQKSLVVRVYESLGGSSRGVLHFDPKLLDIKLAFKTDALENEKSDVAEKLTVEKGKIQISLRGFEIATYKINLN